jgi:ATP-dependent RNA helicase DeaD
MFSATISADIEHLSKKYMRHPKTVEAESQVDPSKLVQTYYDVPSHLKLSLLVHMLRNEKAGLIMVFCNTRNSVDYIADNLQRVKLYSVAIHGGLTQGRRNNIMEDFHSHQVSILVCTDVAARGLDIKGVTHVYNYDIPKTPTEYVHRIGRTARAGKEGKAISLVASRDYENFSRIQEDDELRTNLTQEKLPYLPRVDFSSSDNRNRSHGRSFVGRDSRNGGNAGRSFDGNRAGGSGRRFESNNNREERPRSGGFQPRRSFERRDDDSGGADFFAQREKKLRARH